MWVLTHLDDVESDFSAVHRVGDIHMLTSERFFRLAERLVHYQGAVRDMALAARNGDESPGRTAPRADVSPGRAAEEVTDLSEVRRLREAARLRQYPPERFGEHKTVPLEQAMREVSRG